MDKSGPADEGIPEPIAGLMRDADDMSLLALSTLTRIPYATLWRRVHEPELLTMGNLLRISEALGVSPGRLLPQSFAADAAEVA